MIVETVPPSRFGWLCRLLGHWDRTVSGPGEGITICCRICGRLAVQRWSYPAPPPRTNRRA